MVAVASQKSESACENRRWERFVPALRRLDAVLAQAVEIARLRFGEEAAGDPYRGLQITPDQVERALATGPGTPLLFREALPDGTGSSEAPSLTLLRDTLGLEDFDLDVVVIALAPELDLRYERLYGYLQDESDRRPRPQPAMPKRRREAGAARAIPAGGAAVAPRVDRACRRSRPGGATAPCSLSSVRWPDPASAARA